MTATLAGAGGAQALSPTTGGMQNVPPLPKGSLAISTEMTNASNLRCGNSTPGNLLSSHTCHIQTDTCVYTVTHSSTVFNNQLTETTQAVFTSGGLGKQTRDITHSHDKAWLWTRASASLGCCTWTAGLVRQKLRYGLESMLNIPRQS